MKDFELKFSGLALGKHQFSYEIEKTFFDNFQDRGLESELIQNGKILFELELDKKENLLVFDINYSGFVIVNCDVCLDELKIPVGGSNKLLGKFSSETSWGKDEVIFINPKEHKIDLTEIFFETIHLNLPLKLVHNEGDCDPKMLEKLKEYKIGEASSENADPRWNTLKDLFKDKN